MIDNNDIHWSNDDELLSQFVLHQLSRAVEERLSSHLAGCEKCRQAVNKESRLITGMKLAGREQLKERLKSRLAAMTHETATSGSRTKPGNPIPWTRIAGIAATVAIIISVGVYNNWFITDYRTNSPTAQRLTQSVPDTTLRHQDKNVSVGGSRHENEIAQSPSLLQKDNSRDVTSGLAEHRKKSARMRPESAREEQPDLATAEPSVKGEAEGAAKKPQNSEDMVLADQAKSSPTRTFWVKGYVLPQPSARDDVRPTPQTGIEGRVFSQSEEGRVKAKKDVQRSVVTQGDHVAFPISLKQKPAASLPSTMPDRRDHPGTIQTFIEDSDNGMQVTLFLDSLVSASELEKAEVEVIQNDSLVIHLPNQRIGLSLPPALSDKVNSNSKK